MYLGKTLHVKWPWIFIQTLCLDTFLIYMTSLYELELGIHVSYNNKVRGHMTHAGIKANQYERKTKEKNKNEQHLSWGANVIPMF